jgi:hypothetical protein
MNYATRILRRDVDAYIESRRVERRGERRGKGAA